MRPWLPAGKAWVVQLAAPTEDGARWVAAEVGPAAPRLATSSTHSLNLVFRLHD